MRQRRIRTFADILEPIEDPIAHAMAQVCSMDGGGYDYDELLAARDSLIRATTILVPWYQINWHHAVIGDALEKVARGEIKKLMILVPPQHGKTFLASNIFPAWLLGRQNEAVLACAYSSTKAKEESLKAQRLMESQGFRALFPLTRIPSRSDARRGWIRRAEQFNMVGREHVARYFAVGIDGPGTGHPRSIGLIDDPVKNLAEARSEVHRERVWDWYGGVYSTRQNKLLSGADGGEVRDVLIMTPWDEDDLHGRLLEREGDAKDGGAWHVIRLPAILDEVAAEERHPLDPRGIGDALWPEMNPIENLLDRRAVLPSVFEALYQCRPRNPEGGIFRKSWFKRCKPSEVPEGIWTLSIDATFGTTGAKKDTHSYVSMQVWCLDSLHSRAYFVDEVRERLTFPETLDRVRGLLERYPQITQTLVENKANGAAIIQTLRNYLPGVLEVNPTETKIARAGAMAPWVESGNVYVVEGSEGDGMIDRCTRFPAKGTDDTVDAMTQTLARMGDNPLERLGFWASIYGR